MAANDLDEKLRDFLDATADEKRRGHTIADLFTEMHEYRRQQEENTRQIKGLKDREFLHDERIDEAHDRLDAHRNAIVQITRKVRRIPDAAGGASDFDREMDTGKFDVAAIQREVSELKHKRFNSERVKAEETQWWKQHLILALAGVFGFIATTVITILVTMAISNSSAKHEQPTIQVGH